jgi:hypothetical protein
MGAEDPRKEFVPKRIVFSFLQSVTITKDD